jgi:Lrp/AsnC family leucine-responsive transcriptional regulator
VESVVLDRVDRRILAELRADGRASWRELAERVHLSPNAVAERVRRLERAGVIRGYAVEVDQRLLGRTIEALIDVRIPSTLDPEAFEQGLRDHPDVIDAVHVTGAFDYLVHVLCLDVAALDALTRTIKRGLGAETTESRVVLRRV